MRRKKNALKPNHMNNHEHKHPAGWETARGGSMTSCKYLSTDLNTLTVVYACWENKLGSKSCYLQWGKILSNILVVNAIFREGNILLEGLEFDSFFLRFCLKPEFRSNFGCHFAALFSQVSFLRRYAIAVFLQRFVAAVFSHRHCQARIYMCILLLNLAVPLPRVDTLFGIDSLSNCQALSTPPVWALKLLPWTLDFATNCPLEWLQERWTNFISLAIFG